MASVDMREVAHDEHAHPGAREYVNIAAVLTVVTAIEVGLYFVESLSHLTLVIALMVLMVFKFALVVGWYMHLKFDHPYFTIIFVGGLLVGISIVISLAALFGVFDGSSSDVVRESGRLAVAAL
jgi:cytochrome c oxidase subunit 4